MGEISPSCSRILCPGNFSHLLTYLLTGQGPALEPITELS